MKKNRYLLPACFRLIGWIISVPSALAGLIYLFSKPWDAQPPQPFQFFDDLWFRVFAIFGGASIIGTVCMVLLMVGLLFVAFSKEKIEDEYITKLRGDSLIWAVIVNAILMIVLSVTVFGGWFLYVSFFNLYTMLALFIVKFNIALIHMKKQSDNEE
jgi:hypothetical protein